jgi:hypothetical protein
LRPTVNSFQAPAPKIGTGDTATFIQESKFLHSGDAICAGYLSIELLKTLKSSQTPAVFDNPPFQRFLLQTTAQSSYACTATRLA